MKRGMRKTELEWEKIILQYLFDHKDDNNHLRKIAEGIDTTTPTATKYLFMYRGLGWIWNEKIVNVTLYHISNKGIEELNKLKGGI